jgi:hypothetical protein
VTALSPSAPGEVLCEEDDGCGNFRLRPVAYIIGSTVHAPATPPADEYSEWDVDMDAMSGDDAGQFEADFEEGVHDVAALWGLGG